MIPALVSEAAPAVDAPVVGGRGWRRPRIAALAVVAALAVAYPAVAGPYPVSIAAAALIFAVLAASTQLLTGVAGLPSMAQPAYYGVGAYTAALLGAAGHTLAITQLAAATLAAALAGALTGPLLLRTRGTTFLMAGVALQSLAFTAAGQWRQVTGGDNGLHAPPVVLWPGAAGLTAPAYLYWYVLAVAVLLAVLLAVLMRSRLVLVLRAIAGHEPRTAGLGHRVTARLATGYTIATAFAGAAGALTVALNQYVSPADLNFDTAALVLLAAAAGAGRMTGAVIAAVAIVAVRDGLGVSSGGAGGLLLGGFFIAVAYRRPLHAWLTRALGRWRS